MFRFEHPEYLWAFVAIPVLLAMYFFSRWLAMRARRRFATDKAMERLLMQWSAQKEIARVVLIFCAIAVLCMAVANPQWGTRKEKVQAEAADVFIALDISNSMYAEDIAPSRMERAKKFAADLVHALRGERIGLILFAGHAYLQMPLTSDYAAALLFVKSAHPGQATTQGTSVGEAIELALRAFEEEDNHSKAIVIITDGENHEEGAVSVMKDASDHRLIPFLVSVGTEEGGLIPISVQGQTDYKRDEQGNPVRTTVNEEFLRELAEAGGGSVYSVLDASLAIEDIKSRIAAFDKRETEERSFSDFESYYQYFLLAGILLLMIAWMLGERKRQVVRSMGEKHVVS
jgi:Ca-activated chloride channel family protein